MAGVARMPSRHLVIRYHPYFSGRVNGIRTDKELPAFSMYHAVGRCSAYTFIMYYLFVVRSDFI